MIEGNIYRQLFLILKDNLIHIHSNIKIVFVESSLLEIPEHVLKDKSHFLHFRSKLSSK